MDAEVKELRAMRNTLSGLIDACAGDDHPTCPILPYLATLSSLLAAVSCSQSPLRERGIVKWRLASTDKTVRWTVKSFLVPQPPEQIA